GPRLRPGDRARTLALSEAQASVQVNTDLSTWGSGGPHRCRVHPRAGRGAVTSPHPADRFVRPARRCVVAANSPWAKAVGPSDTRIYKIGRASCRERGEVVDGAV